MRRGTVIIIAGLLALAGCGDEEPAAPTTTVAPTTTTVDPAAARAIETLDQLDLDVEEMVRQLQHGSWKDAQLAGDRAVDTCDRAEAQVEAIIDDDGLIGLSCMQIMLSTMPEANEDQDHLWLRSRDLPESVASSTDAVRSRLTS